MAAATIFYFLSLRFVAAAYGIFLIFEVFVSII